MKKSEKTRNLIIDNASRLFNQKGFAGTSMSDIMEATGLKKGGIYGHFKSKDEIAVAAFEHSVQKVLKEVGKRTRVVENTIDKLKTVVYFYKERILDPPVEGGCPIQNTAVEADDNNPILQEKVLQEMEHWHARMVHTIHKGIKKGEIRIDVDADEFATLFIGTLEGGILMSRIYKEMKPFDVLAKHLIKMIEELKV